MENVGSKLHGEMAIAVHLVHSIYLNLVPTKALAQLSVRQRKVGQGSGNKASEFCTTNMSAVFYWPLWQSDITICNPLIAGVQL